MLVTAAPGHKVPREDDPRKHIEPGQDPVEVPNTSYYRRRIAAGELQLSKGRSSAKKTTQEPAE